MGAVVIYSWEYANVPWRIVRELEIPRIECMHMPTRTWVYAQIPDGVIGAMLQLLDRSMPAMPPTGLPPGGIIC